MSASGLAVKVPEILLFVPDNCNKVGWLLGILQGPPKEEVVALATSGVVVK